MRTGIRFIFKTILIFMIFCIMAVGNKLVGGIVGVLLFTLPGIAAIAAVYRYKPSDSASTELDKSV